MPVGTPLISFDLPLKLAVLCIQKSGCAAGMHGSGKNLFLNVVRVFLDGLKTLTKL